MSDIPASIFKAYDVRGLSPGEITDEAAYRIGQAAVAETGASVVLVGRDMRKTSLPLERSLLAGIRSQGADAIRIGLTSTPMFYFAVAAYELHDAGVMVTASHNPARYNGFKLVRGDAMPIGQGSGMEQVRDRVLAGRLPEKPEGRELETDVVDAYVAKVCAIVPPSAVAKMKIAIDAGNGMAGHTLPKLLAAYPRLKTERLYFELDGTFPNHEANPIKEETLADLQERVRESGAAFGVAFDGDADRVGIVDEDGAVVEPHLVLALLAKEFLDRHPGATILYDCRSSRVVPETIEAAGGKAIMTRVGHAFIKKALRETGAVFAGEFSSHFYFKDFYGVECSDAVWLMVAEILSREKKTLSALVTPFRRYSHSGEINFELGKGKDKGKVIEDIERKYAKDAKSVWREDGIRLDFADWWVSVRASNTEPLLRLVVEAKDVATMQAKRDEIAVIIKG